MPVIVAVFFDYYKKKYETEYLLFIYIYLK